MLDAPLVGLFATVKCVGHPPGTDAPSVGLARLLAEYRQRTGESYRVLEQHTGIPRGWFSNIHTAKYRSFVEPETLRKLATGLRLPIAGVVNEAIITAGYAELMEETPEARN